MFRRVYGSDQAASSVDSMIDEQTLRPHRYKVGEQMTEFERCFWTEFYEYGSDPELAKSADVTSAHLEAVGQRVKEGMSWEVNLRTTDGLSLRPLGLEGEGTIIRSSRKPLY